MSAGEAEELQITIDAQGGVSIEVIGVEGGRCLRVTKSLEDALGQASSRELKAEFYNQGGAAGEVVELGGQ